MGPIFRVSREQASETGERRLFRACDIRCPSAQGLRPPSTGVSKPQSSSVLGVWLSIYGLALTFLATDLMG